MDMVLLLIDGSVAIAELNSPQLQWHHDEQEEIPAPR
jgi:hypothetical protein